MLTSESRVGVAVGWGLQGNVPHGMRREYSNREVNPRHMRAFCRQ